MKSCKSGQGRQARVRCLIPAVSVSTSYHPTCSSHAATVECAWVACKFRGRHHWTEATGGSSTIVFLPDNPRTRLGCHPVTTISFPPRVHLNPFHRQREAGKISAIRPSVSCASQLEFHPSSRRSSLDPFRVERPWLEKIVGVQKEKRVRIGSVSSAQGPCWRRSLVGVVGGLWKSRCVQRMPPGSDLITLIARGSNPMSPRSFTPYVPSSCARAGSA